MIFYGSKGKHLHSEQASGINCDHCKQQTQHTISVFGKYAYIYWIPIFPMGKKVLSECNHCKATLEPKQMNEQLKLACQNTKGNAKTPIWFWSGGFIIAALILFAVYSGKQHDKDVINYKQNPQVGDVIQFKDQSNYSTVKIANITQDSIFLIANDYEISRQSKIYKIDKAKNYTSKPYAISKDRFLKLFDEKIFLDINR
ncbi:hypothetical protein SAMN05444411_10660 [Lutibacter oricola]|uniref:Zinc-ribbon 15 domain-containing protein n=1 Tax=Lutibacter oricola TaxID=762486 RepID=A0A1H3C5F8_9FLAO|nr:hypothetical protein [Lutibacter oricola]SDX49336.1 hypothetical protein SAMN05444411_10660 [Lutibacter oricola]